MNQDDRSWKDYYFNQVKNVDRRTMHYLQHAIKQPAFQGDNTEAQYQRFLESKEKLLQHVVGAANRPRPFLKWELFDTFGKALQPLLDDARLARLKPQLQAYLARYMEVAARAGLVQQVSA